MMAGQLYSDTHGKLLFTEQAMARSLLRGLIDLLERCQHGGLDGDSSKRDSHQNQNKAKKNTARTSRPVRGLLGGFLKRTCLTASNISFY